MRQIPDGYEQKFSQFIKMCRKCSEDGVEFVVIAAPWVLGDTYEELIESLTRLSIAELKLCIVPPKDKP